MDPIAETLLEILGLEIARRLLGPEGPEVPGSADQPFRERPPAAPGFPSDLTIHVDQWQGPPCDIVDALYEQRLFDLLTEEEDCGCLEG